MKKYLFQRDSDSKWIFGKKITSVCKAGLYRIDPKDDDVSFVMYAVYNRDIALNSLDTFSNYKKENGDVYLSLSEFLTATIGFFDPSGAVINVAGPVTDAQLRATALPVTGPATDAQLRASALPVTGPATDAQLRATALPVSGPVTDAQLRATALPVSGPATDAQLRAAPLPTSKVAFVEVRLTRPGGGDTTQYAINDVINSSVGSPVSVNLPDMALANGRGGYLMQIDAASDMLNLVDATLRLWFYRLEPTGLVGDNVTMTNNTENIVKGRHYIDIKFNSLLAGSTAVLAQSSPIWNYVCDVASKDMKLRVQTLTAFTPTSGGYIDFTFTVTQL